MFFIFSNTASYASSEIQSLFPNNYLPFHICSFSLSGCVWYMCTVCCTGMRGISAWWHVVWECVLCMCMVCMDSGQRGCWVYKFITFYIINLRESLKLQWWSTIPCFCLHQLMFAAKPSFKHGFQGSELWSSCFH